MRRVTLRTVYMNNGSHLRVALGKRKPGRIKPGRIKRAALSLQNQNGYTFDVCRVKYPGTSNYRYIFLGPVLPPIRKSGFWEQPRLIRPRLYSSDHCLSNATCLIRPRLCSKALLVYYS